MVLVVKNPSVSAGNEFDPWIRKIPSSRKWQFNPVFLPGKVPETEEPGRL